MERATEIINIIVEIPEVRKEIAAQEVMPDKNELNVAKLWQIVAEKVALVQGLVLALEAAQEYIRQRGLLDNFYEFSDILADDFTQRRSDEFIKAKEEAKKSAKESPEQSGENTQQ